MLTRPTPTFNLEYDRGSLAAIQVATNGQPYLTQVVAYELVQHLNLRRRKKATLSDVETAITNSLNTSGEYFADLWLTRSETEQEAMRIIASSSDNSVSHAAIRALRDYDVLNERGDFKVPLVKRWVQENHIPV